jgi:NTE family protein
VDADVLLASPACPTSSARWRSTARPYWDGGYLGNPALWPLYHEGGAPDILIVQINAILRPELPTSASDIMNRLNEISFNASLMSEMRAIDFVQRCWRRGGWSSRATGASSSLHRRRGPDAEFKLSTKLNGDWEFLQILRRYGHQAADRFLAEHFGSLGRESTLDIKRYL